MAPFCITGTAAIAVGVLQATGVVLAAATGGEWLVAYLVLIAGVAQIALGAGQAWLVETCPAFELSACEWGALNLGNVGIVSGSLLGSFWSVLAGSVAFVLALTLFVMGVRQTRHAMGRVAYYAMLACLFALALAGLVLAAAQFPR